MRHSHSETVLNSDLVSFRRKEKPPWRQILYEEQPYEDNHVGKDFLQAIILNAHVQPYDYFTCVRESSVVCQQISLICIFVITFAHSLSDMLPVDFLIGTECFFLIAGYAVVHLSGKNFSLENVLKDLFTTFVLISILLGLAPLLQTLTDQFSSDTITALIIILLIVHAFTHDYAYVNGYSDR
jgi:phosphatidylinositol glycan class C protein